MKKWLAAGFGLMLSFVMMSTALAMGAAVAPMPEDIYEIYDIEDARSESGDALVTRLYRGSDRLGYDAGSNTFYCTLGMEQTEWPEIVLSAPEGEAVEMVWVDDYSFDDVRDAIREGIAYEILCYTEDAFSYCSVVFTGLPMVIIDTDESIDADYVPCSADIMGAGYEAIHSDALIHSRGGGFVHEYPKDSYRLELHYTNDKGKDKKNKISVLGMEPDSDWLLIASAGEPTCTRNYLGWQLWNKWHTEGEIYPAPLTNLLTEVFVKNEYVGVYQLMQRVKPERELTRIGGNTDTDYMFRIIRELNIGKRTIKRYDEKHQRILELRYKPEDVSEEDAFAQVDDFILKLNTLASAGLNDEAFTALALETIDIREAISYFIFMQAASLPLDNVENNTYIWITFDEDGNKRYRVSPWDMDMGFIPVFTDGSYALNAWMDLPMRLLNLNVGGAREILWEIWNEKRETILTEDAVYDWIMQAQDLLNDSGAYRRESARWQGEAMDSDLREILAYTTSHLDEVDNAFYQHWGLDQETDAAEAAE